MIKGEYDYLKSLAEINKCAEHGKPLTVATHPSEALYVLRCDAGGHQVRVPDQIGAPHISYKSVPGHYPDTIRHIPSLTEEFQQGTLPDGPIADNIKKRSRKQAMSTNKQLQTQVLGDLPKADLATGEMLAPEQVVALTVYAKKYGLDPYRGHVVVMYGKPYIGIDGYLYFANKTQVPYNLSSRPLDNEERISYQIEEGDHAWISYITFFNPERTFQGIGIVTQKEIATKSTKHPEQLRSPVVAAHPWQLAQKRAEWQALRRGFPIGKSEETQADRNDEIDRDASYEKQRDANRRSPNENKG